MDYLVKYARYLLCLGIIFFISSANLYSNTDEISGKGSFIAESSDPIKNGRFPFRLLATLLGDDTNEASCIVMNLTSGKQEIYRVGEQICGYEIALVTRACVTLTKHGNFYFLSLPHGNSNKPAKAGYSMVKVASQALKKELPDFNWLLNEAQPIPYIESGKVMGLQIPSLKNKGLECLLNIAGLKKGDIATSINGEKIDSLQKALTLYGKFSSQKQVDIEIKRGNTFKNLTYVLD